MPPSFPTLGVRGLVAMFGLVLIVAACDSNSDEPPTGTLAVSVSTSGEATDSGYTVAVGETSVDVEPTGSVTVSDVAEGPHEVVLSGLKANCSVGGANPRSVTILQGDTTGVSFGVTCQSNTGAVEIAAQTTGETLDEDGYVVSVDGSNSTRIEPNGRATVRNLSEGSHEVVLDDRQVNCSVSGDNPESVSVAAEETTTASFELTCPKALLDGLVFQSNRAGNNNVHAIDRDGTDPVQITTHSATDSRPTVSPDGGRIAFNSPRDGNNEIYTVNSDGSGLKRLTTHAGSDAHPAWAPSK